jgi:hypothetical protein
MARPVSRLTRWMPSTMFGRSATSAHTWKLISTSLWKLSPKKRRYADALILVDLDDIAAHGAGDVAQLAFLTGRSLVRVLTRR